MSKEIQLPDMQKEAKRHEHLLHRMIKESSMGLLVLAGDPHPTLAAIARERVHLADRVISMLPARSIGTGLEEETLTRVRDHQERVERLKGK